jgi:hypothetical protein
MADPKTFFDVLSNHGVDYVVVGKLALALQGVPVVAESMAIFPLCERPNNERLADALNEIDAVVELEYGTGTAEITAELLESGWRQLENGMGHRFVTSCGIADIVYLPEGLEQEE